MNLKLDTYACEYPQKDGPCGLPAFDWIELKELSPPMRIRVCAAHWQGYQCAQQTFYSLPPNSAPRGLPSDSRAESVNQSPENSSRQAAARALLDEFAEWLAAQDAHKQRLRRGRKCVF
ncbi:MAG: hypothetical protein M3416_00115 [Acidobacteriota bacterium]|nr:hypothetical protein [Acidobacteriota bacterium]